MIDYAELLLWSGFLLAIGFTVCAMLNLERFMADWEREAAERSQSGHARAETLPEGVKLQ